VLKADNAECAALRQEISMLIDPQVDARQAGPPRSRDQKKSVNRLDTFIGIPVSSTSAPPAVYLKKGRRAHAICKIFSVATVRGIIVMFKGSVVAGSAASDVAM
jgi:hypothetical protein